MRGSVDAYIAFSMMNPSISQRHELVVDDAQTLDALQNELDTLHAPPGRHGLHKIRQHGHNMRPDFGHIAVNEKDGNGKLAYSILKGVADDVANSAHDRAPVAESVRLELIVSCG